MAVRKTPLTAPTRRNGPRREGRYAHGI